MSTEDIPASVLGDIDHILEDFVGASGLWQYRFMALCLTIFGASYLILFIHLFAAYTPQHRCYVPTCDGETLPPPLVNADWTSFAIPKNYRAREFLTDGFPQDPCHVYPEFDVGNQVGSCVADNFDRSSNDTLADCENGYVFDESVFPETIATKFELVCDEQYKARFLSTLMMLGLLIGSILGGWLADKLGRRKTLFIASVTMGPSILLGTLSPNYYVYAGLRLLGCTCLPIVWVCGNTITVEGYSTRHRIHIVCIKDIWMPVMQVALVACSYFFRHWVDLHLSIGCACLLAIPAWWMVPESYRWLAENNRKEEAFKVLEGIAKVNGKVLDEEKSRKIRETLEHIEQASSHFKGENKLSFVHMFKRDYLFTSVILILTWATTNVGSYTLTLNATKLSGDVFINFLLAALGEVPATVVLFFTLARGRRLWNLAGSLWILGACCLVLAFIPKSYRHTILVFYLIGKCSVGAAFLLVWLITAEIYPTNLRGQALGTCSTLSRVFGLVCPFVANLAVFWKPLPMVVLGMPAIVFGALSLVFLPETVGRVLPQNMQEAMDIKNNSKKNNKDSISYGLKK